MAQPVSVLIDALLCSWRHRTSLIVLGCMLLVTTSFAGTGEEVRRFDHTNDGKRDQWEYYRDGALLRVEVDWNHDRRADEWTFYENGKLVWTEFDTNGDGQVNQREFYNAQGQMERVAVDRDGDGRMEQRLFCGPGKTLLRAEVDADGDGRPEQWHAFQDGQLREIALNTNHDGRPDQWHHYHPGGELSFIGVFAAQRL
jgi:antitoxin component YwqK of YwqJK toxin-antitoxin module